MDLGEEMYSLISSYAHVFTPTVKLHKHSIQMLFVSLIMSI